MLRPLRAIALVLGSLGILRGAASPWNGPSSDVASRGRVAFRDFTDREGLPQNSVCAMVLDRDGRLWAGTLNGLGRYDGRQWVTVPCPEKGENFWVNQGAMAALKDGTVWIGTRQSGLFVWDREHWTRVSLSSGLPGNNVNAILESSQAGPRGHRVYVGTFDGGLAYLEGGSWHTVPGLPTSHVYSLLEVQGPSGPVLWAGTDQGAWLMEEGLWRAFPGNAALASRQVRCLADTRDAEGRSTVWLGTDGGGLGEWRGGKLQLHRAGGELPSERVMSLLASVAPDGGPALWVGTEGGGLARWDQGGWRVLDRAQGLPSNLVRSLAESVSGDGRRTLWIGTDGKGAARFVDGGWVAVEPPFPTADPRVQSLLETVDSRGVPSYWMGGLTWGLARFSEGAWKLWGPQDGLPRASVRCLFAWPGPVDGDDLWVGTDDGLAHFDKGRWTRYDAQMGLPSRTVRCIAGSVSPAGARVLWVGTDRGLVRVEGERWTLLAEAEGLANASVRCLLVDGARLWVGTDGGLSCLEGGRCRSFGLAAGLSSANISSLLLEPLPDGRKVLWIGTYGGGADLLEEQEGAIRVRALSTQSVPALPSDMVDGMQRDPAGRVYLFTSRGVERLGREAQAPGGFKAEGFSLDDGLPGLECLVGASLVDRRGRLWAGTVDGLAVLDPAAEAVDRSPKRLLLERAALDGKELPLQDGARIQARDLNLGFEYALLSFHREGETRYRTQLEGLETRPTDWVPEAKRDFVHLPPGSYTFRVWGRDYAGNVTGPASFAFTVPSPWWSSWWAVLLYAAAGAGLVLLVGKWRERLLAERNHELEAQVAQRTAEVVKQAERLEGLNKDLMRLNLEKNEFMGIAAHDLKNPLTSISLLAESLQDAGENLAPATRQERLGAIARASSDMNRIVTSLLDVNAIEAGRMNLDFAAFDLLPLVRQVLMDYEQRAGAKGITLHLKHQEEVLRVYAASLEVKQVLDNLVSNAVKYSPPGRSVWVALAEMPGAVFLEVKDEGAGLTESDRANAFKRFARLSNRPTGGEGSTGLGLSIVKRLVEAMHGRVWVESEPGKGSAFCIELPKG